ncbi:MAG: squalene/phytoene synthase family protein [Phycisphaerales bacterium]
MIRRCADPLWPGFAATVHAYRIPAEWTRAVLDAIAWRLANEPCADEEGLRKGVLKLGAGLGMIAAAVCGLAPGAEAKEAMKLARRRGAAMQLVWILRDLRTDYDASPRRVCLPADSYEAAGVRPHELRVGEAGGVRAVRAGVGGAGAQLLAESSGLERVIAPGLSAHGARARAGVGAAARGVERDPAADGPQGEGGPAEDGEDAAGGGGGGRTRAARVSSARVPFGSPVAPGTGTCSWDPRRRLPLAALEGGRDGRTASG